MAFPSWILGVILILFGSIGNNLGNNLVSLDHSKKREQAEKSAKAPSSKSEDIESTGGNQEENASQEENAGGNQKSLRVIGVVTVVLANLATFASFGFGAQSLLASLESVQFISNVVFVKFVHKQEITIRMLISTIGICAGNILVVIFAEKHADTHFNSKVLLHLYATNISYQVYLGVAFINWIAFQYIFRVYHHARMIEKRLLWNHSFLEPFAYAWAAAIIGAQAVLFSKCMSMLIQLSFRTKFEENEFVKPTIWVVLVLWISCVSYWIRRLDQGLELFPPLFIIPVLLVFFMFFAIVCGGLYFKEFETFNTKQILGFVFGVILIMVGVYGLAPLDDLVKVAPEEVVAEQSERQHADPDPANEQDGQKDNTSPVRGHGDRGDLVDVPTGESSAPHPSQNNQHQQQQQQQHQYDDGHAKMHQQQQQHHHHAHAMPSSPSPYRPDPQRALAHSTSGPPGDPPGAYGEQGAGPWHQHQHQHQQQDDDEMIRRKKKRLVVKRPSRPVIVQVDPAHAHAIMQMSPVIGGRPVQLAPLGGTMQSSMSMPAISGAIPGAYQRPTTAGGAVEAAGPESPQPQQGFGGFGSALWSGQGGQGQGQQVQSPHPRGAPITLDFEKLEREAQTQKEQKPQQQQQQQQQQQPKQLQQQSQQQNSPATVAGGAGAFGGFGSAVQGQEQGQGGQGQSAKTPKELKQQQQQKDSSTAVKGGPETN